MSHSTKHMTPRQVAAYEKKLAIEALEATAPGVLHRPWVAHIDGIVIAQSSDEHSLREWVKGLPGAVVEYAG